MTLTHSSMAIASALYKSRDTTSNDNSAKIFLHVVETKETWMLCLTYGTLRHSDKAYGVAGCVLSPSHTLAAAILMVTLGDRDCYSAIIIPILLKS